MSGHEISQRSDFLKTSALFLGPQSPSTSAYLLSLRTHILQGDFKSLKPREHDRFCGACGSIREPNSTKIKRIPAKSTKNRKDSRAKINGTHFKGGAVIYRCMRCHRRTVRLESQRSNAIEPLRESSIASPAPSLAVDKAIAGPSQASSVSEVASSKTTKTNTMDNASSKKRAKARKQGGLQALLAAKQRSQSAQDPSTSLDLLDFLQK